MSASRVRAVLFSYAAVLLVLDQWTKDLVRKSIPLNTGFEVTPFFELVNVQNRGAAFGIFNTDPAAWKTNMLAAFGVVTLTIVSVMIWKTADRFHLTNVALASMFGGALGNLIDRIWLGYVTDFLYFHYREHYWPAFNVADSAIVAGALLLAFELLLPRRSAAQPTGSAHGPATE